ncbi:alcohol dehydrogenase catalytic domain-containing protein [Haloarchaeobius litoreus]|uniref:Alcohol dehydrogenase catalytic domain-containing protein n=1 Tax=Haloarchaeobius litoreus TaxID=755306 RepID=A0ABD6DGT3_9EURY|nr:alcohol dehydrogenase catalytic domain-containing protein [Haloarchaeobius litoreus]
MRAMQVTEAGEFELVERPVPAPDADEVRIAVAACGVCRGDGHVCEGGTAHVDYPRVPGHEFVGYIDAVGERVTDWDERDRVGVGWHGGHCFTCGPCRDGEFVLCENKPVTGMHRDGGYAEYATASASALATIPEGPDAATTAPLLCAGLTSFNALRNADVRPGDLVAVVGIGGLGHLALQYAHEAGFETVAVSRGSEKRETALELGAAHFVDSEAQDPAEALTELGGADLVFATAPASDAIAAAIDGLGPNGEVLTVGIPDEPVPVEVGSLTSTRGSFSGWASGTPSDAEDTVAFGARRGIETTVETFDLADAEAAYRAMDSGEVRYRAVVLP